MSRKAVVFGVTGQDGSYLAEFLLLKGYEVYGVARRTSTGNTKNLIGVLDNENFHLITGDVTDTFFLQEFLMLIKPDEVYNLAAQSHVGVSFKNPATTFDITFGGCFNILNVLRSSPYKFKMYQASSSEMFGNQTSTRNGSYDMMHQDEDTRMVPNSPYATAKLAAHNMCRIYREAYGLHVSCGILFNHESERRGLNFVTRKVTHHVATKGTSKPLVLGNLDAKRDWGYAPDYVRGMWLMLQMNDADDYVLATEQTHSIRELCAVAYQTIGVTDWQSHVQTSQEFMRDKEVPYLLGCANKAKLELEWSPQVSFEEMIEKMVCHDLKDTDASVA